MSRLAVKHDGPPLFATGIIQPDKRSARVPVPAIAISTNLFGFAALATMFAQRPTDKRDSLVPKWVRAQIDGFLMPVNDSFIGNPHHGIVISCPRAGSRGLRQGQPSYGRRAQ
jgi:hypothetical protein